MNQFENTTQQDKSGVISASIFYQKDPFGLIPENEGDFDAIPFDLLIDESHVLDFDISDHAVENGAVVSDHVQQRLRSIEVSGMFTNHPLNKKKRPEEGDKITLQNGAVASNGKSNASLAMWDRLLKLAKQKKKVRLVTSLEIYDEMIIESVSASRGPEDGESIKFSLRLRELKTAKVEKRIVNGVYEPPQPPKLDKPQKKAVSAKKKKGKKSAKEIDPKAAAQKFENAKSARTYKPKEN